MQNGNNTWDRKHPHPVPPPLATSASGPCVNKGFYTGWARFARIGGLLLVLRHSLRLRLLLRLLHRLPLFLRFGLRLGRAPGRLRLVLLLLEREV